VSDPGVGFEHTPREAAARRGGGWGLVLIESMADSWGVEHEDRTASGSSSAPADRPSSPVGQPLREANPVSSRGSGTTSTWSTDRRDDRHAACPPSSWASRSALGREAAAVDNLHAHAARRSTSARHAGSRAGRTAHPSLDRIREALGGG
jgi:hypothetical protein